MAGEGRGAATMTEEHTTENKLIKIAEKRAQMDAVLRTGALSDFFTQDLDEPSQRQLAENGHSGPKKTYGRSIPKASIKQINLIKGLLSQKDRTTKSIYNRFKVTDLKELNVVQAKETIDCLMKLPDANARQPNQTTTQTKEPEETVEPEEVERGLESLANEKEQSEPILNFQAAWLKQHYKELVELELLTGAEAKSPDTISFLTQAQYKDIFDKFQELKK